MQRNVFWQAMLLVIPILLALNVIGPWLLMPIPSHSARPTENKVVPYPEIPRDALKGDVMHTPIGQLTKEKAKASAEVLQQTLNQLAKDGWELHTISMDGSLIFKR